MPNNFKYVSFDIETLDTCASAVVLSIGVAKFNIEEDETYADIKADEDRCFYTSLEMQPQLVTGRTISADTIKWWMEQSKDAQRVFSENKYTVMQGLADLTEFCKGTKFAFGNGNMFDNVIIRSLYTSFGMQYPYHYRNDIDLRTLKIAAGDPKISVTVSPNSVVKHNALDDAVFQAVLAQQFWQTIHRGN